MVKAFCGAKVVITISSYDVEEQRTSLFMAKYDKREDNQILQTGCTATHDAPWSFLLNIVITLNEFPVLYM